LPVSSARVRRPVEHEPVFRALHQIAVALTGVLDPHQLARLVAEHAQHLVQADAVGLFVWNEGAGVLEPLYAFDAPSDAPLRPGEGVAGQAFAQRRPVLVADYPRQPERLAWAVERGTCVAAAVPLIVGARAIGVLAVRRHHPRPYTLEQAKVLTLLAAFVAPALEAARLHAESDHQRRLATEQSERLATILEQLPSAVLVLDAHGYIVLSNSAARRATGDTYDSDRPLPEQVDRYRPRDPVSRRVLQATETPSARVLRGEVVDRAELLVWHAEQKSDAWLHVDGVPLQDASGRPNGAVLVYTDVTRERTLARDLAATALEHARLLGQLAERKARLERLAEELTEPTVGSPTPTPRATVEALSARDQEILRLMALGRTNRQIGVELHLSHGTVRNRVGGILDKLGAADRTHAAVLALAHGMLETE
jgi:PAS domain S-box-containing protein